METTNKKKCRGRPPSFNRDELISEVMELFWEHGYNNLALSEIAKKTGLTRASLYNAFETKEALFLEAVVHYFAHAPDAVLYHVKEGEPVGPAFYNLFERASTTQEKRRGCLAVNCMSELTGCDTEPGITLAHMFEQKKQVIEHLIRQAVQQKELPEETDIQVTANILQTFMSGFSVFSKKGMNGEELKAMSYTFLQKLGFTEPRETAR